MGDRGQVGRVIPPEGRGLRLFVAVWPSPAAVSALAGVVGGDASVRWVGPEQWHVTLRFMGDVASPAPEALGEALAGAAAGVGPALAVAGPATRRLGRGVLVVPVAGLDQVAEAVRAATAGVGSPETRPFSGHLTVARSRGRQPVPARLAGRPATAEWDVDRVTLVRSRPGPGGPVYETLSEAPLTAV